MSLVTLIPATIAAGQSLSAPAFLGEQVLVGIAMPSTWTAAALTFQASSDGGVTWGELYTAAGVEMDFPVAAGQFIAIDPTFWRGVQSLTVRSGTFASPVNQTAAATINLIVRSLFS